MFLRPGLFGFEFIDKKCRHLRVIYNCRYDKQSSAECKLARFMASNEHIKNIHTNELKFVKPIPVLK